MNFELPFQVDPCAKIHCGAGRVCQAEGTTAECVCIPECPQQTDPRRMVCTNKNQTWNSDCEVHRERCLCDTDDARCKSADLKHIHINYYGECKEIQVSSKFAIFLSSSCNYKVFFQLKYHWNFDVFFSVDLYRRRDERFPKTYARLVVQRDEWFGSKWWIPIEVQELAERSRDQFDSSLGQRSHLEVVRFGWSSTWSFGFIARTLPNPRTIDGIGTLHRTIPRIMRPRRQSSCHSSRMGKMLRIGRG